MSRTYRYGGQTANSFEKRKANRAVRRKANKKVQLYTHTEDWYDLIEIPNGSGYRRLTGAGWKIFDYGPGFIHPDWHYKFSKIPKFIDRPKRGTRVWIDDGNPPRPCWIDYTWDEKIVTYYIQPGNSAPGIRFYLQGRLLDRSKPVFGTKKMVEYFISNYPATLKKPRPSKKRMKREKMNGQNMIDNDGLIL